MTEFVYFLGRLHVLVVHVPIGVLLLAAFLETLSRFHRFRSLEPALPIIWLTGAASALGALAIGYLHATEGGFDARTINLHRWSASGVVLFAFGVWLVRAEAPRLFARGWPAAVGGILVLLTFTGHYGGDLTHGATYLAEYAPGPLRAWAGLPPEIAPRPPVTAVADADLFLDVVGPALRRRCGSCHNESRRRGGLSLVGYDAILAGGESGPEIVPGRPAESDLLRRVRLPSDDLDFMPKNDKPPLTPEEIAAIEWWVEIGAPREGAVAALDPPAAVEAALAQALGLPPPGAGEGAT